MVAAAIVAYMAVPKGRGPVRQILMPTDLSMDLDDNGTQRIVFEVTDDGSVRFTRSGLQEMQADSALSLAIEIKEFDITITERISPSRRPSWPVNTASATLSFLAPEHYHILYNSPDLNLTCSTTLHVRPGIRVSKVLI